MSDEERLSTDDEEAVTSSPADSDRDSGWPPGDVDSDGVETVAWWQLYRRATAWTVPSRSPVSLGSRLRWTRVRGEGGNHEPRSQDDGSCGDPCAVPCARPDGDDEGDSLEGESDDAVETVLHLVLAAHLCQRLLIRLWHRHRSATIWCPDWPGGVGARTRHPGKRSSSWWTRRLQFFWLSQFRHDLFIFLSRSTSRASLMDGAFSKTLSGFSKNLTLSFENPVHTAVLSLVKYTVRAISLQFTSCSVHLFLRFPEFSSLYHLLRRSSQPLRDPCVRHFFTRLARLDSLSFVSTCRTDNNDFTQV